MNESKQDLRLYKFVKCLNDKDNFRRLQGILGDEIFNMVQKYVASENDKSANDKSYIKLDDDDSIFKYLSMHVPKKEDGSFNINKVKYLDNIILSRSNKVLDFGGANGAIALEISKRFNLSSVDVADVHPISYAIKDQRIKYNNVINGELPYDSNSFDVICCFMVLHHIDPQYLPKIISELHRCCKKYLLVQEHDASSNMEDILDILHGMYLFVYKENDYDKLNCFNEYKAFYKPADTWNYLLSGFKLVKFFRTNKFTDNYVALYKKVDINEDPDYYVSIDYMEKQNADMRKGRNYKRGDNYKVNKGGDSRSNVNKYSARRGGNKK